MDDIARITELLQPYLNGDQFFIVDIHVAGRQGGRIKVTVLLDSDEGITIDECASVSRRLGAQLDEIDLFSGAPFTLEVSSPGIDFPLQFRRQYLKNVGRQVAVTLKDGQVLHGQLESVGDDHIVVDIPPVKKPKKKAVETIAPEPTGLQTLRFNDIQKTNVEVSFK
ncbi:hypothetical protein GCM10023187_48030 [Nibrella viscosa]|uniref:Ribosome maturation factor RimP n=1 Tax=Nibrella viscosa TaxID=1084524 RepID=A0ABP8KVR2_9BACT